MIEASIEVMDRFYGRPATQADVTLRGNDGGQQHIQPRRSNA